MLLALFSRLAIRSLLARTCLLKPAASKQADTLDRQTGQGRALKQSQVGNASFGGPFPPRPFVRPHWGSNLRIKLPRLEAPQTSQIVKRRELVAAATPLTSC
jgi:hypothetical protein